MPDGRFLQCRTPKAPPVTLHSHCVQVRKQGTALLPEHWRGSLHCSLRAGHVKVTAISVQDDADIEERI